MVLCRVLLLDGSDYEVQVDEKAIGQEVFDKVCEHLSLLEKDYFGFTFRDKDSKFWLRLDKKIGKQIAGTWILTFVVKFYPPNPAVLREEYTRYLLFLQLRTDIIPGRLPCSFIAQALLGSYAIQSQIGDYDEDEHGNSIEYLKGICFSQNQSEELLEKIVELHKTHRGDSPAVAEMEYLDNAKNLAMYGVHMHPVKEEDGTDVSIGVCAIGLLLYKDRLRINRFCWAKLIKISFKRDKFFIKVRPEENERKGVKLTYKLRDVPHAKQLWRIAMEHHTFFRMREPEAVKRNAFSRAGGYSFTGRTYFQAQLAANQIQRTGHDFNRASSTRFASTKSLNALTTGYATEREEKHIAEGLHPAATLNLKKGLGSHSSLPYYDDDDQFGMAGYGMVAGQLMDRYGRPLNSDQNANLGDGYPMGTYGQPPDPYYEGFNQAGGPHAEGAVGYLNGYGPRTYGSNRSDSRSGSLASQDSDHNPLRNPHMLQPTRDQHGNVIIVKNKNKQMDDSMASQEDRLTEQSYERGMAENGLWNQHGAMGIPKTSKRTYVTPNGTIITEYRTEKDGVVETHIEKRTREMQDYEDIDYDEALARAIRAVTDMNDDLAVEKIEIHTKSEETMA